MSFKLLFIGDIYGKSGRRAVKKFLPQIKKEYDLDLIIANGENSTHGRGMSKKTYNELMKDGIDVFTMGNHYFDNKELLTYIDEVDNIVRPANFDFETKGLGSIVVDTPKGKVRISNMLGRIFMKNFELRCPYEVISEIIKDNKERIHIVDFHAEATSEKKSLGYYVSGKVSALLGTHTHIQTADERILNGTAYITDAGFCGAYESVLGINVEGAIEFCKDGYTKNSSPAMGEEEFNAVMIEIDEHSGKALQIKRISLNAFNK